MGKTIPRIVAAGALLTALVAEPALAGAGTDQTMLLLVGEEEPMVTVASRQPESAAAAPAMVTVVDREEIEQRGYQTLAELLAQQAGFFTAGRSRGSTPYLRGLPDSILFLYDGVPITTDVTKALAPLDQELSLVGVDRVEIVRGPGSVLWGPDAFAGVVNVVPANGRQRPGVEAGLKLGTGGLGEVNLSFGLPNPGWDGFMAINAGRQQFHSPDYAAGLGQNETVADSSQLEAVGTFRYGDWLHLSGRWSEFTRRYTMQNSDGSLVWPGEKETPVNLIKATASKVIGPSHYALTGFYQEMEYRVRDTDVERRQHNAVSHLELLWDRRLLAKSLLSAGISWRRNSVDGAMVRDGFLPDFLAPAGRLFVPDMEQADFGNELFSVFGQFRSQWGATEWWIGARLDDHSQYQSAPSFSLGFNRLLTESLRLKGVYGSAFRSPYSSQLFENIAFEPEAIRTTSLQLAWLPAAGKALELSLFHSDIKNHRSEDPYSGLSFPADREILGAELTGRLALGKSLELNAGLTVLGFSGNEDSFQSLRYTLLRPDGSRISVYDEWTQAADQGPSWLANLGLHWLIAADQRLQISGRIAGPIDYSYNKGAELGSYSHPLLLDLTYRRPGIWSGVDTISLKITNLLDRNYQQADIFGPVAGPPLQAVLSWAYRF